MKTMQKLICLHKKYIRKIANPKVSIHEKRKVLQKAKRGNALTSTLENIFHFWAGKINTILSIGDK